ncbi:MAG: gamma-glutamyltransferase [Candidatus Marinimicrobia bacterium]|nr:gamma-glutamyltransferase [Candidatus Neomarinimicrobiota bacterium]
MKMRLDTDQLMRQTGLLLVSLFLLFSQSALFAQPQVTARNGMVTSSSQLASDIGVRILQQGGNAVDAAVAVGYALAVTHPSAGNIGGGGFMLLRLNDGTTTSIDYREKAPLGASKTMYQDDEGNVMTQLSRVGAMASGVPGTVAGLSLALDTYGTMSLAQVMQPAIALARDGFRVSERLARSLNSRREYLSRDPMTKMMYLKDEPWQAGELMTLPQLANTLELISREGPEAFYQGVIADNIVETMGMFDGLITREDLQEYQPVERDVIHGTYHEYDIYSMPPPSSGGIAVTSILGILEPFPIARWGHNSAKTVHFKTEAERHVYADRNYFLGDPDFVQMPVNVLTSDDYYDYLREQIGPAATPSSQVEHISWDTVDSLRAWLPEHEETTHYSVIDRAGNAVANTYTLNGSYGAGYSVVGSGFLMNNEMDDFSAKPGVPNMYGLIGAEANSIAPGKRMLSSMTPTIMAKDGETVLITGSPGGSTIITTVAQVIMNLVDHEMTIRDAVASPRVHSQWLPDKLWLEPGAIEPIDQVFLSNVGHVLEIRGSIGEANSIYIDPESNLKYSGADVKRGGTVAGY